MLPPLATQLAFGVAGTHTALEICAGGGGQALGLEAAGFRHEALFEVDGYACETLRLNRPEWNIFGPEAGDRRVGLGGLGDVRYLDGLPWRGKIDLLAGGVPCPPFSIAGKQLGASDERDLFPEALRLARELRPPAVMLENVRGLMAPRFSDYRREITDALSEAGFSFVEWRLVHAADFGVPQLRPRTILIALTERVAQRFSWPVGNRSHGQTVGRALADLMAERRWRGADAWVEKANAIAPTLVGGSRRHGGPDLGPTRARRQWAELGVDGRGIADEAPDRDYADMPRLTLRMTARLQGFSDEWEFAGGKTAAYRQIGNAFPPPVAAAVGSAISDALTLAAKSARLAGPSLAKPLAA